MIKRTTLFIAIVFCHFFSIAQEKQIAYANRDISIFFENSFYSKKEITLTIRIKNNRKDTIYIVKNAYCHQELPCIIDLVWGRPQGHFLEAGSYSIEISPIFPDSIATFLQKIQLTNNVKKIDLSVDFLEQKDLYRPVSKLSLDYTADPELYGGVTDSSINGNKKTYSIPAIVYAVRSVKNRSWLKIPFSFLKNNDENRKGNNKNK